LNKLRYACVFLFAFAVSQNLSAKEWSKKELKAVKRDIGHTLAGNKPKKVYKEGNRFVLVGNSLVFRLEAHEQIETSWKKKYRAAFNGITQLEGVDSAVFQEITEAYNEMFITRLQAMGVTVLPISELEKAKSFSKFRDGAKLSTGAEDGQLFAKKKWGAAVTFTPENQYAIAVKDAAGPFSARNKVPREIETFLYNAFTYINFASINMDISQKFKSGGLGSGKMVSTGTTAVEPRIIIGEGTNSIAWGKATYTLRIFLPENEKNLDITSNLEYANSMESCSSNCPIRAKSQGGFLSPSKDTGVITIHADPVKYKAAVLDALNNYLDLTFSLYAGKL